MGLPPETFWDQTPRLHAAIMRGKAKAFEVQVQQTLALAWHIENFSRSGKRLKPLKHYLDALQPRRPQSGEDVIAIFQGFAARGLAKITVTERE